MTIIELEQGLRNLIASQPSIMKSSNGSVVKSLMGLIDSTKNMIYCIQTYPAQDTFKFSMVAEVQRLEASITSLAVQNLQARGINLMLYIPQNSQFTQIAGQFGQMSANFVSNEPIPQSSNITLNQMTNSNFNMAPNYAANETPIEVAQKSSRRNEKRIDIIVNKIKNAQKNEKTAKNQSKNDENAENSEKEAKTSEDVSENNPTESSEKPSPAEMLMGDSYSGAPSKAAGRDYLVELLKK